jgi:hypothetical protein
VAEKQTTIRLDEDLLRAVKQACLDRGDISQTAAIATGLRLWLGQEASAQILDDPMAGLSAGQEKLVLSYIKVLREQPKHGLVRAIEGILNELAHINT